MFRGTSCDIMLYSHVFNFTTRKHEYRKHATSNTNPSDLTTPLYKHRYSGILKPWLQGYQGLIQ